MKAEYEGMYRELKAEAPERTVSAAQKQKDFYGMHIREEIHRGDVYYADLFGASGSEQGGVRPVVVVQNNTGNHFSPTVIVATLTSRENKKPLPTHAKVVVRGKENIVLLEQLRTIDSHRLFSKIGKVPLSEMEKINAALKISLGLD